LKAALEDAKGHAVTRWRDSSLGDFAVLLVALSPVVYLAWMIRATAVNVLILDEWDYVGLFQQFAAHALTLQDLLRQHNESRTTLPNLILLGLGSLTHWDTRWEMWISFLFAATISASVFFLSRRMLNRRQALVLWAIANLLIFSTEQQQNWLWGLQMIVFMPVMFILLGTLIAFSNLNVTGKFIACILLATASTFSYANGQLAWGLLLAALIIGTRPQTRRLGWPIALWAAAFAANMSIYYHDYVPPRQHGSLSLVFREPIQAIEYFCCFLGASLGEGLHKVWLSAVLGGILLIIFAIACVYILRRRDQSQLATSASIWLIVAGYAVASAAIATVGRLGFGVGQSQDSRYTTFSIYLVIGLLYLVAIIVRDIHRRGKSASAAIIASLGLALILAPQFWSQIANNREMWSHRRGCLAGRACLQLVNVVLVPDGLTYPESWKVLEEVGFLDQMGYISPGLVKGPDLSQISEPADKVLGYFDVLERRDNGAWRAEGWALDPTLAEPAKVVILAGENSHGTPLAFAVAIVAESRPDVAKIRHHKSYEWSGWGVTFKSSDVPPGTRTISAWDYDQATGRAYRLMETHPWQPLSSSR
jgi:hypothetical protein